MIDIVGQICDRSHVVRTIGLRYVFSRILREQQKRSNLVTPLNKPIANVCTDGALANYSNFHASLPFALLLSQVQRDWV
jgi:hypothetical protein